MNSQQFTVSFPALGGMAVVGVTAERALDRARAAAAEIIGELDRTCSRFRDDSELTALNAASGAWSDVSPMLRDAIAASLRAARLTDGDVDPTIGRALIALGYDRDFDEIRADGAITFASVPGWRAVELDEFRSRVRAERGVIIDLGATAKALGADRAADAAAAAAGCGVVVALSGDLATAGPPPTGGWRVRITDDHRAATDVPGQWIAVHSGGLATSSTTARSWTTAVGDAHHLIDPATGRPVQPRWRTASVAAASCLDANIASTATIIRGDGAPAWLESLGLPSRLVDTEGRVRHLAGWPSEGEDLPLHPAPEAAFA
jgi:thiamine biosynthesis lipoprotein